MSVSNAPASVDRNQASGELTGKNRRDTYRSVHRVWFLVACTGVVLLAIIVFRAAFSAYFLLDDFGMLAIARFLDNPFGPLIHDQFPGGLYYRPLGMLVWWISERAFGAVPFGQYCLNLGLHCLVALALGRLVSRLCENRWIGLIVAACFVLHPIGIGTTLWLSDRFDLLALLFGLLGLTAALQFSRVRSPRSLCKTLLFLSLSLLSKEMALACFAGAGMLWLNATDGRSMRSRIRDCVYLLVPAIIYLIVRTVIVDYDNAQALFASAHIARLLLDGMVHWLAGWTDYFLFWVRLDGWKRFFSISSTILLAVLGVASMRRPWSARRRQALLAGSAIWLSSGLLQWPLLSHFSVTLGDSSGTIEAVVNARYFYTSLAGFLIALAALLAPLIASKIGTQLLLIAAFGLLVPWFAGSQNLARVHRTGTQHIQSLVNAANVAINTLDLPTQGCQIYLLDTDDWSFGWISDEAIKATTPSLKRVAGCLVQTEHTPWYHIAVIDRVDENDLRPMTLIQGAVQATAIRPLGRAKFLKLNLDKRSTFPDDSKARFLSWQKSSFVDVTDDVLEGRRKPTFACNRPESDCPR